jgi:hypothetical protein
VKEDDVVIAETTTFYEAIAFTIYYGRQGHGTTMAGEFLALLDRPHSCHFSIHPDHPIL